MPIPIVVTHNGRLIPASQARVSIFNPALYGAFGVYESIQVAHSVVFHLNDHLERLAFSAAQLDLPLPATTAEIADWIPPLLAANGAEASNCLLRLFVLGPNGREPAQAFVWPEPPRRYPLELYQQGAGAVTFVGMRALPQAKSLNTLVNFLARRRALAVGEHEGLLVWEGVVSEGSTSNLFIVREGVLWRPPPETVLAGVTQQLVIRLATELGIEVKAQPLQLAELPHWDEAFLTSTSRHVMPLVRIDGQLIGNGKVGPVTQKLHDAFEAYFRAYIEARQQEFQAERMPAAVLTRVG
ncbi:MAG TPA: hypothetical protein EYP04_09450 [Anaerolineae bacterium]|nr:hypothetical protein [Anaerolineae bacterium]HIQ05695.1 hypothetical protein [Anaerolineae bacterium]